MRGLNDGCLGLGAERGIGGCEVSAVGQLLSVLGHLETV